MAVLTLVYVSATIWLVLLAHRQLRLAYDFERGRTRPFIVFDLVLERHFVFATIKNHGQTPALNVRVSVTPGIKCDFARDLGNNGEIPFIARGVAMLTPQRSITALVGHWNYVKSDYPKLQFEGTVGYLSSEGISYTEPFIADLSAHDGLVYLGTKDINEVAKQLEEIAATLDRVATGYSKPLIRTMTETENRAEQQAFIDEAQRHFEERNPQAPDPPSSA